MDFPRVVHFPVPLDKGNDCSGDKIGTLQTSFGQNDATDIRPDLLGMRPGFQWWHPSFESNLIAIMCTSGAKTMVSKSTQCELSISDNVGN